MLIGVKLVVFNYGYQYYEKLCQQCLAIAIKHLHIDIIVIEQVFLQVMHAMGGYEVEIGVAVDL